jgi:hypothetical protein
VQNTLQQSAAYRKKPSSKRYSQTNSGRSLASKFEEEIFEAQNRLRRDPESFIPILNDQIRNFNGKLLKRGPKSALHTTEG